MKKHLVPGEGARLSGFRSGALYCAPGLDGATTYHHPPAAPMTVLLAKRDTREDNRRRRLRCRPLPEPGPDRPGGITLNFAVNAKRLFPATDTVGVITALGNDPESRLVRRALEAFGLDTCLAEP